MLTLEQQKLVAANIGLAHHIANKMKHKYPDEDERISAAYCILINAVRSYDPSRNIKFSTYAGAAIKLSMSKEYFRSGSFHISDAKLRSHYFNNFKEMKRDFREEFHNFPSLEVEKKEEAKEIHIDLSCLNERERFIIEQNFYNNVRQSHLAEPLKLSKERVRQIRKKALEKIEAANPHLKSLILNADRA